MSRIGKKPVVVPKGVKISIDSANVSVEGPKGKLSYTLGRGVSAAQEGGEVHVKLLSIGDKQARANYGTARASIQNMVTGVTQGWKRSLEMNGVGYNAKLQGQNIVLSVGFSHEVPLHVPKEIKCTVGKTTIDLEGPDVEVLGTLAARIRKVQPPEPYLGKGVKYIEEKIRRKVGKSAAKK